MSEGRKYLKQIGARDLGDRHLADVGEGETTQARQPLTGESRAVPSSLHRFQHTRGGFSNGRGFAGCFASRRVGSCPGG